MFTGIIEEIGIIKEFSKSSTSAFITVECKKILDDVKVGDSIAINGVCQTVIKFDRSSFSAEISSETLSVTNFSSIKTGSKVNLERALTLQSRLGGHMVSGHVDGLSRVKKIQKMSEFYDLSFELSKELEKYVAKKGSVCLNGISLTVADIFSGEFSVAIIPHTFENTCLKDLHVGNFVNLEVDILAKYVEKFLSRDNNDNCKSLISENFLKENGFF